MKMRICILAGLFLLMFGVLKAQQAKVIGYLPSYRFHLVDEIDFCKLTHLNIAFANPDSDGHLQIDDITAVVNHARNQNASIQVFISLAGGALSNAQEASWSNLIDIPENRPAFIEKIMDFVKDHSLDGVDVDLEWSHVTSGYSGFVVELAEALHLEDLLITAALPASYRYPLVSDEAIESYDWINLMAYDLTGPWDPSNEGPHSPYFFAKSGIDYWKAFDIPGDKLTLGVPFYGYEFQPGGVSAFTYRYMVNMDTLNAYVDQVGSAYYNGIPTIQEKVELASEEVSGTMIWEIGQDHYSQFSLLKAIHEKYISLGIQTVHGNCVTVATADKEPLDFELFPNPADQMVHLRTRAGQVDEVQIIDANGRMYLHEMVNGSNIVSLETTKLRSGIYFVLATSDRNRGIKKLTIF